jgi:hypothetical protein
MMFTPRRSPDGSQGLANPSIVLKNQTTTSNIWRVCCVQEVGIMDSEFLKQRAAHCRILAEKADPFIKRRLLDLAARYEASLPKQPSQASIILTAQVVPIAQPRPR